MLRSTTLVLAVALATAACDNDPGRDKSRAQVSDPKPAPAQTQAQPASTVAYAFGQADSKIEWVGAKVSAKHDGSFGTFRGTVRLVDGDPTKSSVQVEIDTPSLQVEPAKLAGHLKSPDFFDVQKYPKATFTSTSVKQGGDKGATHTITGNLELHGVTKSITFPATVKVKPDGVAVDAELVINRKDFGIVYPGMPDDLIKDDVLVKLTVRASKPAS